MEREKLRSTILFFQVSHETSAVVIRELCHRISLEFLLVSFAPSQLLYSDYRILSRNRENIQKESVAIRTITLAIMWSFSSFQFAIVLEFLLTYINVTYT